MGETVKVKGAKKRKETTGKEGKDEERKKKDRERQGKL